MRARVLIHVQHLLGIGHLKRAAVVAGACAEAGLEVTLVSGSLPVADLDLGAARLVQLPPARSADDSFSVLLDADGVPVDAAWEARRRRRLLALFARLRPHVLVLEMFPFGRRRFRFELMPLLDAATAARSRPRIVSSLRDILVPKTKPGRNEEIAALIESRFDHVLVHGDPALAPLEMTYPLAARIAERIVYSGYVAAPGPAAGGPGSPGHGEVIVSAGGGAVGEKLLRCAIAAREHTCLAGATWRVLAGANIDATALHGIKSQAPAGVVVEPTRSDFPALIANCALSISQAGYNTVVSVIQAGARAVVAPFAGGKESEQSLRAELLRRRGALQVVDAEALSPATLAGAVDAAREAPPASVAGIDLGGAETSARLIAGWAGEAAA